MTERHDLPQERRAAILATARATLAAATPPGVRLVYAYGSFVRGEGFRDLDLAVLLDDAEQWRLPARVGHAVWEAIGRPTYEVDAVPLNDAAAEFRFQVADQGALLYEREPREAIELWVRAASERTDHLEWRRAHGF